MNKLLAAFVLICFCAFYSSCLFKKGSKNTRIPTADPVLNDTSHAAGQQESEWVPTRTSEFADLWNQLQQRRTDFTTFSGKAHVSYDGGGNSQEFDVNIRIEKDRRIWVSITALLGLEAARVLVTPDSIFAIDRIHRDAYVMPLLQASQLLPVPADFQLMQALILGDVLPAKADFTAAGPGNADSIVLSGTGLPGVQNLFVSKKDSQLLRQTLTQNINSISIVNGRMELIEGRKFSLIRQIQAFNAGVNHLILMEFNDVHFNQELDMNFSIPSKYQRR